MNFSSALLTRASMLALISLCCILSVPAIAQSDETKVQSDASKTKPLTEIIVTAELLESDATRIANSITVLDATRLTLRNAQHLEDLLNLAPNVNFSTGASRGRFIQIRGIGERSEFQEPIINSVGLIVDGIDFTGIAGGVTMLDVQQVEVLRGPQGTLYGANAMAGLINVVSNRPSEQFYARVGAALQEYGGLEYNAVLSGPSSEQSGYRFAFKRYSSDGFTDNVFLGRDDTGKIDESSFRASYVNQINNDLSLDLNLLLADIDNGYDAFSLDNTRQTYSDAPGQDQQETVAAAVKLAYQIDHNLKFEAALSAADSDLSYSYDEDWSHPGICNNTACDSALFGFDWFYASTDSYSRNNRNTSVDLRLISSGELSSSWVVGVYHRDQDIDLLRAYTFASADFASGLNTTNTAVYGQLDFDLSSAWRLSTGLRYEQRDLRYLDNLGGRADPSEGLWGGKIALEYQADSGAFYYGLVSRGYKPGGFNLDQAIPANAREFDSESMLNYEFGVKNTYLDGQVQVQFAAFYQDRADIQTKQSIVASIGTGSIGGDCPCSFTDFTDNATSGTNKGIELEFNWLAGDHLNLFGSLGLLDTEFDRYLSFQHVDADRDIGIAFNLEGRAQAHAPAYQWVLGGSYIFFQNWHLSGSLEGKDEFFFSDRHQEKSDAYEIVNLQLAYQAEQWQVALYAKNVTDELIKTRGFGSFGNDPRNFYETEPYNQFAAPRVVGVKVSVDF